MISIEDKKDCTGCGACVNACPINIIRLKEDEEGFLYPYVDVDRCIKCNKCDRACPFFYHNREKEKDGFPLFYAGQLLDKEELFEVSSGGAFWALVRSVIKNGGVVYGAAQYDVDEIKHIRVDNIDDARKLRRSKYLQSNTGNIFIRVRDDLNKGRVVLFSGTGCQTAALKSFLGNKEYKGLYTCDVVCHGVPSRKVWEKYRSEKEAREGKRIIELIFRYKQNGWSNNQYKITYSDGTVEIENSVKQLFHAGYLAGLFYRPSCGNCMFSSFPRFADITLADYWKYKGKFHDKCFNKGVSLITVNSPKGQHLLNSSLDYVEVEVTSRSSALNSCRHLNEHPLENPLRSEFFVEFSNRGYHAIANDYIQRTYSSPLLKRIINKIRKLIIGK